MEPETSLESQMREASNVERELWARVNDKYPGQQGHNEVLWRQWQLAANRVREIADQMRNSKPGDLS